MLNPDMFFLGETECVIAADALSRMQDMIRRYHSLLVVADHATYRAYGGKERWDSIPHTRFLYETPPKADRAVAQSLAQRAASHDLIVAIGSGTMNDLCKYASYLCGIPYAILASAASMNGYLSANASLYIEGYKQSITAHAPIACYADPTVLMQAPSILSAAGVGDSLCRSTIIQDVALAEHHTGDMLTTNFTTLTELEQELVTALDRSEHLDQAAITRLIELLLHSGAAMYAEGSSAPASQGEHMIAHLLELLDDGLAQRHLHGEIIAVTTLTMARLQEAILRQPNLPDQLAPAPFPSAELMRYCDASLVAQWQEAYAQKTARIGVWRPKQLINQVRQTQQQRAIHSADQLERWLTQCGCPTNAQMLGLDDARYHTALRLAAFTRNRITFLDVAAALDCWI